jgi:hypothetical protein
MPPWLCWTTHSNLYPSDSSTWRGASYERLTVTRVNARFETDNVRLSPNGNNAGRRPQPTETTQYHQVL